MNPQPSTPEADALLTGNQLAIECGRPSMAITRAVARGSITPDFRAGGWSLFRRSRLSELRTALTPRNR